MKYLIPVALALTVFAILVFFFVLKLTVYNTYASDDQIDRTEDKADKYRADYEIDEISDSGIH